jgi:hypothetical protein
MTVVPIAAFAAGRWTINDGISRPAAKGPRRSIMMSIMCAQIEAQVAQIGAMPERSLDQLSPRQAARTSRRSDAR